MPIFKRSLVLLCFLGLMGVLGAGYGYYSAGDTVIADREAEMPVREITVYVTGEVNKPGLVTLKSGSRVNEAINACGGLLGTADDSAINMAAEVQDGMKLNVPKKQKEELGEVASVSKDGGRVNINQADEKTLTSLPGIGTAMAKRIVEYRQKNSGFQSIDDLKKVRGIGKTKFANLKDKITI